MKIFKADLHNHTVLSPCGDLEMTPSFIISTAKEKKYDIIGITDHNTTLQAREIKRIVGNGFPFILCGAEITTKEEAHCLAFCDMDRLDELQSYLSEHLPNIKNNPDYFGYQLLVNEKEEVLEQEERLLISATDQSITEIEVFVHSLDGIFIPAHIDKTSTSVISQLGFIPSDLKADALEFSAKCNIEEFLSSNPYIKKLNKQYIRSSDAHFPSYFGQCETFFHINELSFDEIRMAFRRENGRFVDCK
ncbi:MAG: PHP domain-containing protein [Bacteroidales bacterium]